MLMRNAHQRARVLLLHDDRILVRFVVAVENHTHARKRLVVLPHVRALFRASERHVQWRAVQPELELGRVSGLLRGPPELTCQRSGGESRGRLQVDLSRRRRKAARQDGRVEE